ncbi:MAG: hypothetical protein A3H31_02710 [Gallionellales bacterium RIFCSPLOWO2_02_FULL_57_47]|nr:MAG: hypothetical protein A3H31_02710 [Gallionellales bacterium RIFCSPLOWO2_02_FULL_57_47]OGT17300.1 MAG: hypothetical protein A3J49_02235 [Gallionellales bacterium RIFCSPHIGHO2_02_FULL_57_16]
MTVFQPVRRATLLIPSGPAHDLDRKHLFVILTDPVADPFNGGKNSILLTSLSTLDTALPHDPTCILHPGDHPFVARDSYVSYRDSRIIETAKIINGVASGVFVVKDLMDSRIVDRICVGLSTSQQTAEKIKRFFRMYTALQQSNT